MLSGLLGGLETRLILYHNLSIFGFELCLEGFRVRGRRSLLLLLDVSKIPLLYDLVVLQGCPSPNIVTTPMREPWFQRLWLLLGSGPGWLLLGHLLRWWQAVGLIRSLNVMSGWERLPDCIKIVPTLTHYLLY